MIRNMGSVDRMLRIVVVAAIVVAWALGWIGGGVAIGLGIVATVFLVTSVAGFCPAYRLIGLSTRPRR